MTENLVPSLETGNFRVLSLDGGGARGFLTARILANIEHYVNSRTGSDKPLGDRFDLLVGTSTGGIIALGLSIGKTANEISSFYADLVPKIFSSKAQRASLFQYFEPKYSSDILKKELDTQFGDSTLENVRTDVCITGVSLGLGKPRLHKSLYQTRYLDRQKERLADIALATSAAPTYFKAHRLRYSENIIDGGIFANNPAIVGIVDAIAFERPSKTRGKRTQKTSEVWLMSVGTGEQPTMPYDESRLVNAGLLDWAQHIADVMMESQSAAVDYQARHLVPAEQYIRINPKLKRAFLLDDTALHELNNYADIREEYASVLDKFFSE